MPLQNNWKTLYRYFNYHYSGFFQLNKNLRMIFFFPFLIFLFCAAVSKSMPQFHQMMGERLRSVQQGADTVVWLALSRAAARTQSGQFFQGEWGLQHSFHPCGRGVRHSVPSSWEFCPPRQKNIHLGKWECRRKSPKG